MKHKILTLTSILLIITFTSQQLVWGCPGSTYEAHNGLRPRAAGEKEKKADEGTNVKSAGLTPKEPKEILSGFLQRGRRDAAQLSENYFEWLIKRGVAEYEEPFNWEKEVEFQDVTVIDIFSLKRGAVTSDQRVYRVSVRLSYKIEGDETICQREPELILWYDSKRRLEGVAVCNSSTFLCKTLEDFKENYIRLDPLIITDEFLRGYGGMTETKIKRLRDTIVSFLNVVQEALGKEEIVRLLLHLKPTWGIDKNKAAEANVTGPVLRRPLGDEPELASVFAWAPQLVSLIRLIERFEGKYPYAITPYLYSLDFKRAIGFAGFWGPQLGMPELRACYRSGETHMQTAIFSTTAHELAHNVMYKIKNMAKEGDLKARQILADITKWARAEKRSSLRLALRKHPLCAKNTEEQMDEEMFVSVVGKILGLGLTDADAISIFDYLITYEDLRFTKRIGFSPSWIASPEWDKLAGPIEVWRWNNWKVKLKMYPHIKKDESHLDDISEGDTLQIQNRIEKQLQHAI